MRPILFSKRIDVLFALTLNDVRLDKKNIFFNYLITKQLMNEKTNIYLLMKLYFISRVDELVNYITLHRFAVSEFNRKKFTFITNYPSI